MITFTVLGAPVPQGSKRAFVNKFTMRAQIVEDNVRTRPWRQDVALMASQAMRGQQPIARGVGVVVETAFYFQRPKGHYRANGELKPSAPKYPAGKPDLDKLKRAILDALTGIAFVDDSQVVGFGDTRKRWADLVSPSAVIRVEVMP